MSTDLSDVARALPDYDVGPEVGRGQYGIVWSARHRQLGREVAIKQLAGPATTGAEHTSRFRREARILAQMDHPHVVTVYDYRENDRLRLLVMELLTGGSFADRRAGGMSVETAIASALAAASGLHHVHEQGILHRDVKPENLMFDRRGTLKVTDFGIARGDFTDATAITLTHAGQFFGTPAYVSPEQAGHALGDGWPPIDATSDQYSLAAVLYEALSGALTHDATGGAVALCNRRMNEDPRPLREIEPDVPAEIEAVVMKALARDPNLRYATTAGFAVALGVSASNALGADWLARSTSLVREAPGEPRTLPAPTRSAPGRVLPSGIVTLLLTDVVGSTKLWEAHPEAMRATIARHDALVRAAAESAGGHVFKSVGDGFWVAFTDPVAAVDAAVAIQHAVTAEEWSPTTPVRVRIAIHTGACDERDGDYFGRPLNRVARLEAIAHGGQTLVSGTTAALVADRLPGAVALVDLGSHRLKDLDRPEHVWQLDVDGLASDFPVLRSLSNPRLQTNIPTQTTSFLGRDREVTELLELLESARLVTIVGPGGVGKTRLALQAAVELLDGSGDGVWLVELAPVSDPDQVVAAVTRALGIRDDPTRDPLEYLVDVCLDRDTLIVLDNCEHTIDAVAQVANELVQRDPDVHLIATSRQPLNVRGEHVYRIPALALPDPEAPTSAIAAAAAVALFVERARQHDRDFTLDDTNAATVASICWQLDGIPLAIELAAARLRTLSLEQLDTRLDQRFRILTGGTRTDEPRQQTLQALVEWSWDLLDPDERAALARASVFSGSFDLDAAEGIVSDDRNQPWTVVDQLAGLVDKSLVQLVDSGRYRLLETIRAFAAARLDERGDGPTLADAHLAYYLRLALAAEPHLLGHDQLQWWARLDPELDNITSALRHALTKTDPTDLLELVVSLRSYWSRHGVSSLATDALDAVLDRPTPAIDPGLHCRATIERAWHYFRQGRFRFANDLAEQAIGAARALDDTALLALGLVTTVHDMLGEPEKTLANADEALSLAAQLGDTNLTSRALQRRAGALRETDGAGSRDCLEQSLALDAEAGDQDGVGVALLNLAQLDLDREAWASARTRVERALGILATYPNPMLEAALTEVLGFVERGEHRDDVARTHFERAFAIARRAGDQSIMVDSVLGCALTEADGPHAAVLHGAADALLAHAGSELAPTDARSRATDHARLRSRLGDETFAAHYSRGRTMSRSEIIALALR